MYFQICYMLITLQELSKTDDCWNTHLGQNSFMLEYSVDHSTELQATSSSLDLASLCGQEEKQPGNHLAKNDPTTKKE